MITDQDAKILHQRAVAAAGALIDAEVRFKNGQLDEIYYRSFKVFLSIKQSLSLIAASNNVEFILANNDKEIQTFLEAWQNCAPTTLEFILNAQQIQDHLHHGMVPIYAFDKHSYEPLAVILCIRQGVGLPFMIREPYYLYTFSAGEKYKQIFSQVVDEVLGILEDNYSNV